MPNPVKMVFAPTRCRFLREAAWSLSASTRRRPRLSEAPAFSTSRARRAFGVFQEPMLLNDERAPQRDHHQDAEQPSEHRDEHDARNFEIEAEDQIAGIVTPTPKAIDSPAEPAVWTMLFSRIVASRSPNFERSRKRVMEMTATGIEALTVRPTFRTR